MTGTEDVIGADPTQAVGSDHQFPPLQSFGIVGPMSGVPGANPASLALRIVGSTLMLEIVSEAGETLMLLGPFEEEDIIAIWRSMAAASGLRLAMRKLDGTAETLFAQIGRLQVGKTRSRRRVTVLTGRRPRFLVRRKSASLPGRPLIYRESEIAGGRGC